MSLIALIILIPIFCIGLVMYIMTLFNYAFADSLDVPLLTIGLLIVIILSFIIIKLFYKNLPKRAKYLNSELKSNTIYNIFTFIIMLIFGFFIFLKSFNGGFDLFDSIIGIIMVMISLYAITSFFLNYEETIVKIIDIEEDEKIKCLTLEHEKYGNFSYYIEEDTFKKDEYYKVKLNRKTKIISTIINKVHNIE